MADRVVEATAVIENGLGGLVINRAIIATALTEKALGALADPAEQDILTRFTRSDRACSATASPPRPFIVIIVTVYRVDRTTACGRSRNDSQ